MGHTPQPPQRKRDLLPELLSQEELDRLDRNWLGRLKFWLFSLVVRNNI